MQWFVVLNSNNMVLSVCGGAIEVAARENLAKIQKKFPFAGCKLVLCRIRRPRVGETLEADEFESLSTKEAA